MLNCVIFFLISEEFIIAVIKGIPTVYDAFVCYNPEGDDLIFVQELIQKLEEENGLKLFVPWRDDLPGASHNTVTAKLIEQR